MKNRITKGLDEPSGPKFKLRTKIILIFIILFSIPIILALVLIHRISKEYSEESIKTLNINNMTYVQASANRFFGTAYDYGMHLNQDKNIQEYFLNKENSTKSHSLLYTVQDTLVMLPMSNKFIKSVGILGKYGQYVGSGTERLNFSVDDIKTADSNQGAYFWSISEGRYRKNEIQFCRLLRQGANLGNSFGYLKISLDLFELDNMLLDSTSDGYTYYILNENSDIIYDIGDFDESPFVEILKNDSGFLEEYNGKTKFVEELESYVTPVSLDYGGWYICSISNDKITPYLMQSFQSTMLMSGLLCFVFCFILAFSLSTVVISPLKKLGALMKNVQQEDYSVRFIPRGKDEIAVLAHQFNHMTERLDTLYNEVYLSNLKIKDAQLASLQAQINPHFLYNTLDTIFWMSEFNHTSDVSQMVSSLSKLFRLSLSGDENDMVPLSQELEHSKCYLHIQQIRFQDQLAYNIDNRVDAEEYSVLKLVLQPIIENAIIHGIEKKGSVGIQLIIEIKDDKLMCSVIDDAGAADVHAIEELLKKPIREGKHIGLKNINDRIILRFGEEYGIRCRVENGKTIFCVLLPITEREKETYDQNDYC